MAALQRIAPGAPRGGAVELRLLGIDPEKAAERAPAYGGEVLLAPRDFRMAGVRRTSRIPTGTFTPSVCRSARKLTSQKVRDCAP